MLTRSRRVGVRSHRRPCPAAKGEPNETRSADQKAPVLRQDTAEQASEGAPHQDDPRGDPRARLVAPPPLGSRFLAARRRTRQRTSGNRVDAPPCYTGGPVVVYFTVDEGDVDAQRPTTNGQHTKRQTAQDRSGEPDGCPRGPGGAVSLGSVSRRRQEAFRESAAAVVWRGPETQALASSHQSAGAAACPGTRRSDDRTRAASNSKTRGQPVIVPGGPLFI